MARYKLTTRLSRRTEAAIFSSLLVLFSLALGSYIYDLGFYPEEEGLYMEMAEQVTRGRLPHLDFQDPSVGGMDFLHAAAFQALGHSVLTGRICLLVGATIALLFGIQILYRSIPIGPCFAIILACVLWGPAAYLVPTPNWYGAFLALAGAYLLLRYCETQRTVWLLCAGSVAGLGLVFHLPSGLLQVMAAGFFLFYLTGEFPRERGASNGAGPLVLLVKAALIIVALGALILVLMRQPGARNLVYFASGPVLLGLCLLLLEVSFPGGRRELWGLLKGLALYLVSGAAVVAAFLLPFYVREGAEALTAVWNGAVLEALRSAGSPVGKVPGIESLIALIPLNVFVLLLYLLYRERAPRWTIFVLIVATAVGLFYLSLNPEGQSYRLTWAMLRLLLPEAILFGVVLLTLARLGKLALGPGHRKRLALVVCLASALNLLQLPDCSGYSFLYAFPFLMLLVGELLAPVVCGDERQMDLIRAWLLRSAALLWLIFSVVFAWAYVVHSDAHSFGVAWIPRLYEDQLGLERARVFTSHEHCRVYEGLARVVSVCSPDPGRPIMAFPDCQPVFFLTGRENLLRTYEVPRGERASLWELIMSGITGKARVLIFRNDRDAFGLLMRDFELLQGIDVFLPVRFRYSQFQTFSPARPWDELSRAEKPFAGEPPAQKKKWPW